MRALGGRLIALSLPSVTASQWNLGSGWVSTMDGGFIDSPFGPVEYCQDQAETEDRIKTLR
jgi:hypothetical protein